MPRTPSSILANAITASGITRRPSQAYDLCSEKYPAGNKAAAAQLKKGFSLLALDQKTAGIRELRSLIQRFPDSHEAELARQRLKKLGIAVPAATAARAQILNSRPAAQPAHDRVLHLAN